MANEANWPIVGGEYRNRSYAVSARVTAIEGDRVSATYIHPDGRLGGNVLPMSVSVFRKSFLPEDESPILALTKALRGYQAAAESWHECHHNKTVVGCDAICDLIPEGRAALALVEAIGG